MPKIIEDKSINKKLKKLLGKGDEGSQRFERTKKTFEENKNHPSLDFKKHHSFGDPKIFKIKLLGGHDGLRVFLRDIGGDEFFAFHVTNHDRLDK